MAKKQELNFKYTPYTDPMFGKISKPLIRVVLWAGKEEMSTVVLLDTGSDICVFDAEIGEALGLDVKAGKKYSIGGIGGGCSGFIHKVGLTLGDSTHNIEAFFTYELANIGFQIVGQHSFFDRFKVTFNYSEDLITLKKK